MSGELHVSVTVVLVVVIVRSLMTEAYAEMINKKILILISLTKC